MADFIVTRREKQSNAQKAKTLKRSLERDGPGFEFVQAMRLLMRLYPDHAALGAWDDPAREVVRLSVPPSLSFPPSEIARIELPADADDDDPILGAKARRTQARMAIRFFGLTGPQGVLPHVYTEHASARTRERDTAFRDFLDLFHHRALSLFYRGWERHHTMVPAERGSEDRIQHHLLDLVVLAPKRRENVRRWPPVHWRFTPVCLRCARDRPLAVFDPMAMVQLRLGPLTRAQFDAFLPSGRDHETLRQLSRFYADEQVTVSVQLVLKREEIPGAQLSTPGAPVLGFGTWISAKAPVRDADDVHFKLS